MTDKDTFLSKVDEVLKAEIKSYLESLSIKHDVPIERITIGIMQDHLYIWDYNSCRSIDKQFIVLEIL
jgi:hypothetical protein